MTVPRIQTCACCGHVTVVAPELGGEEEILPRLARELDGCPEDLWRFVQALFPRDHRMGRALAMRRLARDLGTHPCTLASRFLRAGLPSPGIYLRWAKLVRGAYALHAPGATLVSAADRVGYSSPQSLGRTCRTVFGMTAGELRARYTGAAMLERFIAELIAPHRAALRTFSPLLDIGLQPTRRMRRTA